jgi:hypothetical protein
MKEKQLNEQLSKMRNMMGLNEAITDEVYHFTQIDVLKKILQTNQFITTSVIGTPTDMGINRGRFFFFSTTRSKSDGYVTGTVKLVLDGRRLSQRYKGVAVDYWRFSKNRDDYESDADYKNALTNTEMEDRIITNDPIIPNAISYIKEIHVVIHDYVGIKKNVLDFIITTTKDKNIPIYFYTNKKDWLLQNKNTTVDPYVKYKVSTETSPGYTRDKKTEFEYEYAKPAALFAFNNPDNYNRIISLIDPDTIEIFKNVYEKEVYYHLQKNALYDNETLFLYNGYIHNIRSKETPMAREILKLLSDDMRKLGVNSLNDYIKVKQEKKSLNENPITSSSIIIESADHGYFGDKTNIPIYDAILLGDTDLPSKYRDWSGKIVMMTKDEYFNECAKIQKTTYSDQFKYIIPENVEKIENNMRNGVKYNIPYLNYNDNEQEGRHRVIAATNLGQKKIPVLILNKKYKDGTQMDISSMIGRWGDLIKDGSDYYCIINESSDASDGGTLLSSIASNFDDYLLDYLYDIKKYNITIDKYISLIRNRNRSFKTFFYGKPTPKHNYPESIDNEILYYAVIYKTLRNNQFVMDDAVKKIDGKYCLKILDSFVLYLNEFNNCNELFEEIRNMGERNKYYINEYDLLSIDQKNELYDLSNDDIDAVKAFF